MSTIEVKEFFEYYRVRVVKQEVDVEKKVVSIGLKPDERYAPVCHKCGDSTWEIHSLNERTVRDLNIFDARTFLEVSYRTVHCCRCGYVVEELELMDSYQRVTKRLAKYIVQLCKFMTITEVAQHLALDWKTVKAIHKEHLRETLSGQDIGSPKLLAIDEISLLKKRHRYLTIIVDWERGRVLWIGEDRKYETVKAFFDSLTEEQRATIQAVAVDMWDPYIKAIRECCPTAQLVFDQFHVV
jgi:transposase